MVKTSNTSSIALEGTIANTVASGLIFGECSECELLRHLCHIPSISVEGVDQEKHNNSSCFTIQDKLTDLIVMKQREDCLVSILTGSKAQSL